MAAFEEVDVILGPTAPNLAWKIGAKTGDPIAEYLEDLYTITANLAGLPGLSMPAGFVDGLPVGVQLLAPYFQEGRLLNVAHQYQLNTDWHTRTLPASGENTMQWEVVIGLEIHTQLATQSKIFSGSATTFGSEPNTQASLVDLGMPGVLPVLNQEAVRMAVMFGLAIDAEIGQHNVFARKNYFYRTCPRATRSARWNCRLSARATWTFPWKTAQSSVSASPVRTLKKTPAKACTKNSRAPPAST